MTDTVQKWHEWHEAFIVFGFAELLHETLGLLLGQLRNEGGQQPEELVAEDGAVVVLVVELEDLDEVVDAAGVLGGLGLGEDGVEVVDSSSSCPSPSRRRARRWC